MTCSFTLFFSNHRHISQEEFKAWAEKRSDKDKWPGKEGQRKVWKPTSRVTSSRSRSTTYLGYIENVDSVFLNFVSLFRLSEERRRQLIHIHIMLSQLLILRTNSRDFRGSFYHIQKRTQSWDIYSSGSLENQCILRTLAVETWIERAYFTKLCTWAVRVNDWHWHTYVRCGKHHISFSIIDICFHAGAFPAMDLNGDGFIDREEFLKCNLGFYLHIDEERFNHFLGVIED